MHQLTASNTTDEGKYELRVELEDLDGNTAHDIYEGFRVSSEHDGYSLSAAYVTGTAKDGLRDSVKNVKFSTHDRDQDRSWLNCARNHQEAWWYTDCGYSSLNGRYKDHFTYDSDGVMWNSWQKLASMKKAEMKVRPWQK